jgi:nondiscriminating aspartyl-tRNA synthetase
MEYVAYDRPRSPRDIQLIVDRVRAGELKDGDRVEVQGSIHRIKEMSGFAFVNIRSPRLVFQCVWEEAHSHINIKDFNVEDCVVLQGTIALDARSRLGFDIRIDSMERLSGAAEQLPIEINNDHQMEKLQLSTLLDNRAITLRNPKVRAVLRVCDGVMHAFRAFLRGEDFVEFIPPKIVQAGAEGGADMFEVDYFGEKAFLNQSPQMYKQIMVGAFNKVFAVSPVFRGEKHRTNRHINEFQGLDLEMGFIDSFEDLMEIEARLFKYMFAFLNADYAPELELVLGKDKKLPELQQFPRIRFAQAKELYASAKGRNVTDPNDLDPDEEKWIGQYFLEKHAAPIVFITHYPSKKRPFYAMDDPEDPRYTLSFDMLLYGLEVTTGGQRIHDYYAQVEKMKQRGLNIGDFEDYLAMHKYGMPPHGGFGMGLERIVQKIMGLDNIRQATAFPRDRDRLRP